MKNRKSLGVVCSIALSCLFSTQAFSASMTLGEFEYRNSCAQCHGMSGKGDGPSVPFLLGNAPADLTMLKKNNDGIFPIQRIYSVIEGSSDAIATVHGTREMPMWGQRYMERVMAPQDDLTGFSQEESQLYARTRILALIEYLATQQSE
jgi:mono/diheme cytochrome c family protein